MKVSRSIQDWGTIFELMGRDYLLALRHRRLLDAFIGDGWVIAVATHTQLQA
jgi:hypothetical protein